MQWKEQSKGGLSILDVDDLSSIRTFCQQWSQEGAQIDMLVHDAGIAAPTHRKLNKDE